MSDELYKAAKLDANGDVKSKGKAPIVEGDVEDDGEAGPELPPDFDAEDIPDDEEGRFFGGGMERKTAQAMQYIDQQDEGETAVWKDLRQQCRSGPSSNVCFSPRKSILLGCDGWPSPLKEKYRKMPSCAGSLRMTPRSEWTGPHCLMRQDKLTILLGSWPRKPI